MHYHKTWIASVNIVIQFFSAYGPWDLLYKANNALAGGLLLPWQQTIGHKVCECMNICDFFFFL